MVYHNWRFWQNSKFKIFQNWSEYWRTILTIFFKILKSIPKSQNHQNWLKSPKFSRKILKTRPRRKRRPSQNKESPRLRQPRTHKICDIKNFGFGRPKFVQIWRFWCFLESWDWDLSKFGKTKLVKDPKFGFLLGLRISNFRFLSKFKFSISSKFDQKSKFRHGGLS